MTGNDKLTLELPPAKGYEKIAMRCLARYASVCRFPDDLCEDIKTIVSEGFINALEHTPSAAIPITVSISFFSGDLVIEITDSGISPLNIDAIPDTISLQEKLKKGKKNNFRGWGLYLIKKLSSKIDSVVRDGKHTLSIRIHNDGETR